MYDKVADFLGTVGRMKFVRRLYWLLNEVDRALAVGTFERHRAFYHPICREIVRRDLYGEKGEVVGV